MNVLVAYVAIIISSVPWTKATFPLHKSTQLRTLANIRNQEVLSIMNPEHMTHLLVLSYSAINPDNRHRIVFV